MNDDMPESRRATAARITRTMMADLKPVPGWRLSGDGKSLIPCRRHWWDWVTDMTRKCRHCGALKRREF